MKNTKKIIFVVVLVILLLLVSLLFIEFTPSLFNKKQKTFEVNNLLLKFTIKQGEELTKNIEIENLDISERNFKVSFDSELLEIKEKEFNLGEGKKKDLEVIFNVKDKISGVYLGEILISSSGENLIIPVIIEIETEEILFDSILDVPLEYTNVKPGEDAIIENKIFNLENIGQKTVNVEYFVKDLKGATIFSAKEDVVVVNQLLISKVISIPEQAKEGDYIYIVIIKYGNSVGLTSSLFKVVKEESNFFDSYMPYLILGGVAIIVGLIGFFVFIYEQRKLMSIMKTHFREVKEASAKIRTGHIETVEANKIAQKLKIQLGLLERAYKKGYIKKSSYEKGKSRLKEVYHKLKKKYL